MSIVLKSAVYPDPFAAVLPDQLAVSLQRPIAVDVHVPLTAYSGAGALYGFLCQPSLVRHLLVSSGNRPSNMMAKWFNASFQCRTGIVHRCDASRIAM
jgi:hypothetical protein